MGRVPGADQADWLIVGSGIGAMVSALSAAKQGLKVLVLEKTGEIGGNSALSGGVLWIPANPLMARAGVSDTIELGRLYLDALIGDVGAASSPERRTAFLSQGPELVSFLESCGIPLQRQPGRPDYYDELPGGSQAGRCIESAMLDLNGLGPWKIRLRQGSRKLPVDGREVRNLYLAKRTLGGTITGLKLGFRLLMDRLLGRARIGIGVALIGHLLKACLDAGVQFELNAEVSGLVVKAGRIAGVTMADGADSAGGVVLARGGVLIAAGGFARSAPLLQRYRNHADSNIWTSSGPGETGEMIEAAISVGAVTALMDQDIGILTSILPDGSPAPHVYDLSKPHALVVDGLGNRYLNESASYMENAQRMRARAQVAPAIPSWIIMDARHRRFYPWANALPGVTPAQWVSSGYLKIADTLYSLARQTGIEPHGLEATVSRFNGFAMTGIDVDFGRGNRAYDRYFGDPRVRPNPSLGSIEVPPFMAIALYPGDVGTFGGLLTDASSCVLREDGTWIEGLYATGTCTASVMGKVYPGAGASLAASAIFGRIAARHCAEGLSRSVSALER